MLSSTTDKLSNLHRELEELATFPRWGPVRTTASFTKGGAFIIVLSSNQTDDVYSDIYFQRFYSDGNGNKKPTGGTVIKGYMNPATLIMFFDTCVLCALGCNDIHQV